MKKLMIATVAAATVGGAFAAPLVYDYKATVKHTYAKEYAAKDLYLKTQKSSTLKGYLIQDYDAEIQRAGNATITKDDVQPANRCFLVVKNGSAEKDYRFVRIVPGIIEAEWYTAKALSTGTTIGKTYKGSLNAQGYLYLGGEMVSTLVGQTFVAGTATDTELTSDVANYTSAAQMRNFVNSLQTSKALTIGIDDYFFTSCYLFGQYNQPDWNFDASCGCASTWKYRWFFGDAWMNGAGFGKASYNSKMTACCGRGTKTGGLTIDSLSGNLKAGLYLCSVSGSDILHTSNGTSYWEDQLWVDGVTDATCTRTTDLHKYAKDTWADGNLDLATTDVGYGTWSIKRNTKLAANAVTGSDVADQVVASTCQAAVYGYIKAAALALDKNVTLFGSPLSGAMINNEFHNAYLTK